MTSIVIAAHNEAAVIGRCLDAVLTGAVPEEFDVTVVANGCTDATARVAAARPTVRVLDLPSPGKVAALNAGDAVAVGYPRIYLDADIVITAAGVRALRDALVVSNAPCAATVLAVTARRELDVSCSPLLVRSYYAINSRLPVFQNALIGRGVIALSAEGRGRFGRFPDVVNDDLFLDSLFTTAEKREVGSVSARIAAPRRSRDMLRRLVRVRRGNASMHAALAAEGRSRGVGSRGARTSWLRDIALSNPSLIPAATCYAAISLTVSILARLPQRPGDTWGRDDSSRQDGCMGAAGRRDDVLNICFHGIGTPRRELEPGEDAYWVDTDGFLRLLDEIATWPSVRISFDDANASDVQIALPALVERGLTGQFFLLAGRLSTKGSLAEDDVRELIRRGMRVGTHGMSHRPWLKMGPAMREAELIEARRRIEDVAGVAVTEAACPLGRYDRRLLSDLRRLGYRKVYTTDRQPARQDGWLQPRFSVHREDTPESLRAALLSRPSLTRRARHNVVGLVKRLR